MLNLASCNGLWILGAIAWLSTALILRYQEVPDFFGVPFGGIKRQSDLPFFIACRDGNIPHFCAGKSVFVC